MIYLDNAATSFPKPQSVLREVNRCLSSYCGNPGRGAHLLSRKAAEAIYETRVAVAELFGSDKPENVFFTYNDTYALNMVIKGLLKKGDHVIISDMEHNSVFRPIHLMASKGTISYSVFDSMCGESNRSTEKICDNIRKLIRPNTRMLIVSHISNICSAELPIKEIGELCRSRKILFVVDAAQSAGHLPIDIGSMHIDALCAPGHKALYGIQGTGFVLLREGITLDTLLEGGSGVNSLIPDMPDFSPERYETGTVSTPAIVSLREGIRFVNDTGLKAIHEHECLLYRKLYSMLSELPKVEIYAPKYEGSTLLFNIKGISSEKIGSELDRKGFCLRSGYHCSPLGHRRLGTPEGGAVRVSFGVFNTQREIDELYYTIRSISR